MEHMLYAKGICWIDDCRIPFVDEKDPSKERYKSYRNVDNLYGGYGDTHYDYKEKQGRFPANILVSDDMLNDGKIGQNNSKNQEWGLNDAFKVNEYLVGLKKSGISRIADKGTNSRYYDIDKWFEKLLDV